VAEPPVVNASPLIFLPRAGLLDLFGLIAETVLVPTFVTTEIQRRDPIDITAQPLQNTAWIVSVEDPPIPRLIQAWDLGEGESPILAWPYTRSGAEVSMVNLAGRALRSCTWDSCERDSRSHFHGKEARQGPPN
jgi:hypothetical protein